MQNLGAGELRCGIRGNAGPVWPGMDDTGAPRLANMRGLLILSADSAWPVHLAGARPMSRSGLNRGFPFNGESAPWPGSGHRPGRSADVRKCRRFPQAARQGRERSAAAGILGLAPHEGTNRTSAPGRPGDVVRAAPPRRWNASRALAQGSLDQAGRAASSEPRSPNFPPARRHRRAARVIMCNGPSDPSAGGDRLRQLALQAGGP